jgi:hypothetical protein
MRGCKFGSAIVTANEEQSDNKIIIKPDIFNLNIIGYMMAIDRCFVT